jgi:hypothetical protein
MPNQPRYYDNHKHCVYTSIVNMKGSLLVRAFHLRNQGQTTISSTIKSDSSMLQMRKGFARLEMKR